MMALQREVNSGGEEDAQYRASSFQNQTDPVSGVADPRGAQVTGKGGLAQALREEKTKGREMRQGAGRKGSGERGQEIEQRTTSGPRKGGGKKGGGENGGAREAGKLEANLQTAGTREAGGRRTSQEQHSCRARSHSRGRDAPIMVSQLAFSSLNLSISS